ncbi:MAG: 1-phosphofructokinase [Bacillota bacterium]|nr:1-phosphofructokinase [Bacillota bacterium]
MIITLTLNPAIDKTAEINEFLVNKVNRVSSIRLDAGGKGINVSKVINVLGGSSIAVGIIAGNNGNFIKNFLDENGIRNDFVLEKGETRVNLKVVDNINHTHTDINESFAVSMDVLGKVEEKIIENLNKSKDENNIVVLSGSIPQGLSKSCYREIIDSLKGTKAKVILDAEGELFINGIESSPYLVKPNIDELKSTFNKEINSSSDIVNVSRECIISKGVAYVVVSMGGEGSLYVSKDKAFVVKGFKVKVKSTVGAGDSMVAALAYAIEKNFVIEKAAALASASSTATVMTEGSQPGKIEDINEFLKKIQIENLE